MQVLISTIVYNIWPEVKWFIHDQVANLTDWRTELVYVAVYWDELWIGVKDYIKLDIAGFPRNLFK